MSPDLAQPDASDRQEGSANSERATNVRWLIFALACGTSFILYLHRYTWGFIKADVGETFGWSPSQLGLLDGIFSLSYGFGQVPAGMLCDWFGPHFLLGTIIGLWSLSMGAVAMATGYTSMLAARLTFGLTQAGCYPTLSKVTRLWFPLSVRTSVQGWIATFFGRGGGAVSFFLVGTVLIGWLHLTWQQALGVLTLLGFSFAVLFALLFRNSPREHPWANEAELQLVAEGQPTTIQATRTAVRWSRVLKSGNMNVFFVQQFTSAYADNVYVYWIPLFLLTVKNVDVKGAGWMAALPLLGGAVGGMLGGTLQNYCILRTGNRRWSRSLIGLIGKMLATVFMFVSLGFDSAVVIVSIFAVVKFFSDWSQPTVWGTVTDIAGRNSASVFGAINTVGSIAAFIAGPTMGLIIMGFSRTVPVESETTRPAAVRDGIATFASLKHLNVSGRPAGTLYSGEKPIAEFTISRKGDFTIAPLETATSAVVPAGCRLDRLRARLRIQWSPTVPTDLRAVVKYEYTDYAGGWTALFVTLGLVYLVSSLCWLFIDCTKPLEAE